MLSLFPTTRSFTWSKGVLGRKKKCCDDEGSMAQVQHSDPCSSVLLLDSQKRDPFVILFEIPTCVHSSISLLKHNEMTVYLKDILGIGREPVKASKGAWP